MHRLMLLSACLFLFAPGSSSEASGGDEGVPASRGGSDQPLSATGTPTGAETQADDEGALDGGEELEEENDLDEEELIDEEEV